MASSAAKRLFKEYRALSNDPPEGITAGPVSEDDMYIWEALIQGPEGTPFEGGVFPAELRFPKDYPLAPPKMKFVTEMWHPNGTYARALTGKVKERKEGMYGRG
jgi:ubiquitin-conjugating enzyme E2 G2